MKINDYIIIKNGRIGKIKDIVNENDTNYIFTDLELGSLFDEDIIKSSPDITDLLQPMDLIYVDVDDNYAGGIIVPRIAETQAELNLMIDLIKSGKWILKGVVTNKQLDNIRYKVGE